MPQDNYQYHLPHGVMLTFNNFFITSLSNVLAFKNQLSVAFFTAEIKAHHWA
jgi:hypothetical protein